ncbi:YopX family protein [uncultured Helicobacter sp.]|uniref:YopX family protein n=1 Tax=uncultured Helicobacter sp. TaxID=175537 RepID=UPI00261DB9B4|nr:YopX family protein [uncultured Helicobacter sp.]
MKLKDIDFRVWSKLENGYIEYPALAKLGSVLPAKVHRADRAIPFIEFDERDDEKEVEFWTGLRDLNNAKIYEGDIVEITNHRFKDTIEAVVIWQQGGFFMKVIKTYDEDEVCVGKEIPFSEVHSYSQQIDLVVIGNIHENPELLGY